MFSEEARAAILAEELADAAQHTADIDTESATAAAATAAETSTAEAATVTVEAMGSQGLPAQHGSAERVPPEAAAQEDTGPAYVQEPVGQTRRSSPTRASTPGAVPRAARGGKAAGTSPPVTQADLRAVQVWGRGRHSYKLRLEGSTPPKNLLEGGGGFGGSSKHICTIKENRLALLS